MLSEFDLIKQYFVRPATIAAGRAALGIGDDCALLTPTPGMQTAISSDMLVEGRHFFAGEDAVRLGHKSLAVNLSDLAAMGARPVAFTLALALPAAERDWLAGFSQGMFALADMHGCELIGGDTTRGPLNICITIFGEVRPGHALRRDAARPGDDIWISGSLGDARLALGGLRNEVVLSEAQQQAAGTRLHTPTPRVALGLALAEGRLAHAAIDISDGLVGDLGHILAMSGVGAILDVDALPAGPVLATQPVALRRAWTAAGGDDYELCFTAPPAARAAIIAAGLAAATPVTRVGSITAMPAASAAMGIETSADTADKASTAASRLRLVDAAGAPLDLQLAGFDHFSS